MNAPPHTNTGTANGGRHLLHSPQSWVAVALLVGFVALATALLSTPIDDAYISFRYVNNWVGGDGLVFNGGEHVEGYSNLLWIIVLAIPALLGAAPHLTSVALELILAVGCLVLLFLGTRGPARPDRLDWWQLAAPLLLAVLSPFLFWIGKGMEVIFYTFLSLAFAVALLRLREREAIATRQGLWLGLLAAAAALTRPEGVVAPAAVLAALLLTERNRRRLYLLALAIAVAAVVGQFVFRLLYYGPLWPNTYYAKRLPLLVALEGGLRYLRQFVVAIPEPEAWFVAKRWPEYLPIWIVGAVAASFALKQWRALWPVALQALALVAVAVYLGGDWMPGFRFLLPAIPLGCLLVAASLREMAGNGQTPNWRRIAAPWLLFLLVATEILGLLTMIQTHEFIRWRHHVKNYGPMAQWLRRNAPAGSLVALSDIGIISYSNPDLRFIDVLGLTDPHIASLPGYHYLKTDVDYVLAQSPDYVLAMIFAWPDSGKEQSKTFFDIQFRQRAKKDGTYAEVTRVPAWREGLFGERWVLFEVYKRNAASAAAAGDTGVESPKDQKQGP